MYISIARYAIQKLHIDSEENEGRDHGASGRFTRGRGIATEPQGASPVVWLKFVTSDAGELHGILDLYYLRLKSWLDCHHRLSTMKKGSSVRTLVSPVRRCR